MTTDQKEKEICEGSLLEFTKLAWPQIEGMKDLINNRHVAKICQHLEAVTSGDIKRLLINGPPATLKSTLVNVMWPAWEWGAKGLASNKIARLSHDILIAYRYSVVSSRLIQSMWYQHLWPTKITHDSANKYKNELGGYCEAYGNRSINGKNEIDRLIWDTPQTQQEIESGIDRYAKNEHEDIIKSMLSADGAVVIVSPRLHQKDISGHILSGSEKYVHLRLPMDPYDYSSGEDELLCDGLIRKYELDKLKKMISRETYQAQYQQEPITRYVQTMQK
jgi:hypothetical protein